MRSTIAPMLAAALCGFPFALHAQAYPNKAVRIVAPFPAGGSADLIPRIIGEKLSLKWGHPVIVENRVGAAGNIGAEYVFKAEPDGYTLLSSPPPPLIINPNLYRNLPFDPTQFVPVEIMFDNLGVSRQHVVSGKLKLLAVCSERRVASLPDVPALAEILPGFEAVAWFGIVAPPKTPMPIAEKISAAVAEVLKLPDVRKRLADLSAEPIGNTPAQMAMVMKKDAERWREVIRSAGVKAD